MIDQAFPVHSLVRSLIYRVAILNPTRGRMARPGTIMLLNSRSSGIKVLGQINLAVFQLVSLKFIQKAPYIALFGSQPFKVMVFYRSSLSQQFAMIREGKPLQNLR